MWSVTVVAICDNPCVSICIVMQFVTVDLAVDNDNLGNGIKLLAIIGDYMQWYAK